MITCMSDQAQAQEASLAQFSVDGHACYIVPQDASEATVGLRIIGSMTLGKRRYSICSDQPNASSAPTELLTSRELQIAVLIAQGFDRKSIGRRLGISSLTVSTHLAHVYLKLGIATRATLAARIAGTVALHRRAANPVRTADQVLPTT
jgi:Response regulator containing a CheY-like receiver domain and an HTH DNA-binding domain